MDKAEDNYYRHVGEAPVDMVFHTVSQHLIDYNEVNAAPQAPPELRRTCTGYFGYTCTPDDVEFKEWEE